ncbi:MAG: hypothetical protein WBF43_10170 [Methylocella sp.]
MSAQRRAVYFSKKALEVLKKEHLAIDHKYKRLLVGYSEHGYKASRAKEYATNGFLRRLQTLVRCIDTVFKILPPDLAELPTHDELLDATINIQAFVFNVFGSIDNLAWIWVWEKGLTNDDGSPISPLLVGLGKKNKLVRDSFSPEFQECLSKLDKWFDNLDNFRHALAHRIPLYIPPYVVPNGKVAAYQQLIARMTEALNRLDFEEHERLSAEQMTLARFIPCVTHSFEEKVTPVFFHGQMLADFKTIEVLAQKILAELDP